MPIFKYSYLYFDYIFFLKICKYYLSLGVDGFRVDLASSIVKDDVNGKCSCEVWQKIFSNVREDYPSAIFVAEWGEPKYAVANGGFDIDFLIHCYDEGYNNLFRKEKKEYSLTHSMRSASL